jgi:HNH endonuclease
MSRHDRTGERIDDDDAVVRPWTLWDAPAAPAAPVPERLCELCGTTLAPITGSAWCRECDLLVSARLRVVIHERWAPAVGLADVIVSDRGRIAKLLPIDTAHRYPRFSVGGRKVYVHHAVAEAWHGERPDGLLVLHADDVPDHNDARNLSWGTAKQNGADAKRNRINREGKTA